MQRHHLSWNSIGRMGAMVLVGFSLATAAYASKPEWAGKGKSKHKDEQTQSASVEVHIGEYFHDDQRRAAVEYYGARKANGHCPPGLAKKNNGCMPPGQAKKWAKGQPLPNTVVWYPVPQAVTVKIGLPPKGYRYVRVANDILMIAIGTSMVVDAIEDLMQ
jgi:Ni/Co efflux regulator RcnB